MVKVRLSKEMLELIQRTLTGIDYNLYIKKRETENFLKYDILYRKSLKDHLPYSIKLATLKQGGTFLNRVNFHRTPLTEKQADALESFLKILNFK